MKHGDDINNVIQFRASSNPRKKKLQELRAMLDEKERRKQLRQQQQAEIERLKESWKPKVEWGTVLIISISGSFLIGVALLGIYVALQ